MHFDLDLDPHTLLIFEIILILSFKMKFLFQKSNWSEIELI